MIVAQVTLFLRSRRAKCQFTIIYFGEAKINYIEE